MPFFCKSSHLVVTVDQFLSFVGPYLSQEAELHLPPISGGIFRRLLGPRNPLLVVLNGWAWNFLKALSLSWFAVLAILLNFVESTGYLATGSA